MDLNVIKVYLYYFFWSRYGFIGYLCLYMIILGISKLDFISLDFRWYGFKVICVFVNDYFWSRLVGFYWF